MTKKPQAKATTTIKSKLGTPGRSPKISSPRTPAKPHKLFFTFEYCNRTTEGMYTYAEFMDQAPKYLKHKYSFLPKQILTARVKSMWEKKAAEVMKGYETPFQKKVRLAKEKSDKANGSGTVGKKGYRLKPLNLFSDPEPESSDLSNNNIIELPEQQPMPILPLAPKPIVTPQVVASSNNPGFRRQQLIYDDADKSSSETSHINSIDSNDIINDTNNNNSSSSNFSSPQEPLSATFASSKTMISNAFVPLATSSFYLRTYSKANNSSAGNSNSHNSKSKALTTTIERVDTSTEPESSIAEESKLEESTLLFTTDNEAADYNPGQGMMDESTILLSTDNEVENYNAEKQKTNFLLSEPIVMDIPSDNQYNEQDRFLVDFY